MECGEEIECVEGMWGRNRVWTRRGKKLGVDKECGEEIECGEGMWGRNCVCRRNAKKESFFRCKFVCCNFQCDEGIFLFMANDSSVAISSEKSGFLD